ncbi:MAG: hypothetical protein WC003_15615 [Terrimicrobiaceae bacterium]
MTAIASNPRNAKVHGTMKPQQGFKPFETPVFWRRPHNADLDRAGDLLLASLEAIRKEAKSRGDSR